MTPITDRLAFPSTTLFGRAEQKKAVLDKCHKRDTGKQVVHVTGVSGTGKTVLVKKVGEELRRKGVLFIEGKFDQTGSRSPYSAVAAAFNEFITWILSRNSKEFEQWKDRIVSALKEEAGLLVDVIPDLIHITGPRAPVSPTSPMAEKNRFEYLFKRFIWALTWPEYPFVLFLDDLQWADSSSMDLLRAICLDPTLNSLVIIGSCRNNDRYADNQWILLIDELERREHKKEITRIDLQPLGKKDVGEMLSRIFHCDHADVVQLTELVVNRTGGIPMLIKEFLLSLETKKILKRDGSGWRWNVRKIAREPIYDDAVSLITARIRRLDSQQLNILIVAACLGSRFRLRTLAVCCDLSLPRIVAVLQQAENNGFLVASYDATSIDFTNHYELDELFCSFVHDSIQKAFLTSERKFQIQARSGKMGMKLLTRRYHLESADKLFLIMSLFKAATGQFHCLIDLHYFAFLYFKAGSESLRRSGYTLALDFFKEGLLLLEILAAEDPELSSPWELDRQLCREMYNGAARAAFLTGNYEQLDDYFTEVDLHIADPVEKTVIYELKTSSLYARNRLDETLDISLGFAGELGVRICRNPDRIRLAFGLVQTLIRLRNRPVETLAELPEMEERKALAALRVISCASLAIFCGRPRLLPVIVFESIRLSLKYGNAEASIFGYAGYGILLCAVMNRFDEAAKFGRLALQLMEQRNLKSIEARIKSTVHGFITHWSGHSADILEHLLTAHEAGLETGDYQFASVCASMYCHLSFHCGRELHQLFREIGEMAERIRYLKQDVALEDVSVFQQTIYNLLSPSPQPWLLEGIYYSATESSEKLKEIGNEFCLFNQNYFALQLCLIFNRYREGVTFAEQIIETHEMARSLPKSYGALFATSLVLMLALPVISGSTAGRYLRRVRKSQKKLKKWSEKSAVNIKHKYDLVQALLLAHKKKYKEASRFFSSAVNGARENNYLNDQAIAAECAGRFFLAIEDEERAQHYMSLSWELYFKLGAMAKVTHMERHYPPSVFRKRNIGFPGSIKEENRPAEGKNIRLALNAARSIAKETRSDAILDRLVTLVKKNTGAEKVAVLLVENQSLWVQAFIDQRANVRQILQNELFDKRSVDLPASIINYVLRTQQPLILEDPIRSGLFFSDPYIANRAATSVLCMPVFNKSSCVGVLYLEKDAVMGVWPENMVRVLDVLLGQAIVSMENVKLYDALNIEKKQQQEVRREVDSHKYLIKRMSAELVMTEERERKNIADDLHDSVTQNLALSVLDLKKVAMAVESDQKKLIDSILGRLDNAVGDIRSLTFQLSPKILYDFGLIAALEWLADDISDKHGIEVSVVNKFVLSDKLLQLNETANITLYRAVRELLINVCKHSGGDLAIVTIWDESNLLFISVTDNGKGFIDNRIPSSKGVTGFGLVSMQERIEALDGRVTIDDQRSQGCRVTITIPMDINGGSRDGIISL